MDIFADFEQKNTFQKKKGKLMLNKIFWS